MQHHVRGNFPSRLVFSENPAIFPCSAGVSGVCGVHSMRTTAQPHNPGLWHQSHGQQANKPTPSSPGAPPAGDPDDAMMTVTDATRTVDDVTSATPAAVPLPSIDGNSGLLYLADRRCGTGRVARLDADGDNDITGSAALGGPDVTICATTVPHTSTVTGGASKQAWSPLRRP